MTISGVNFTQILMKICQVNQSMKGEECHYTHERRQTYTHTHTHTHTHTAWCSHKVNFFPRRQCDTKKKQDYWSCRKRNELRQEMQRDCPSQDRLLTLFCVTRQLIRLSDHLFFVINVIMLED